MSSWDVVPMEEEEEEEEVEEEEEEEEEEVLVVLGLHVFIPTISLEKTQNNWINL